MILPVDVDSTLLSGEDSRKLLTIVEQLMKEIFDAVDPQETQCFSSEWGFNETRTLETFGMADTRSAKTHSLRKE